MKTLEEIIKEYVYADPWGNQEFDPDEEWDTDDLIELGIVINKILRERQDG